MALTNLPPALMSRLGRIRPRAVRSLKMTAQARKVIMFANRNGFFYTLDRESESCWWPSPLSTDRIGPRK